MIIILKGADFSSSNIGVLNSYLISQTITGATTNNNATTIAKDAQYVAEIKLKSDYTFPSFDNMVITMGGESIIGTTNTNGTQRVEKVDDTLKINIDKVTGNLVIKVIAISTIAPATYYITRNISGMSSDSNVTSVEAGSVYTETFAISEDMALGVNQYPSGLEVDLNVTMGGVALQPNVGEFSAEIIYEEVGASTYEAGGNIPGDTSTTKYATGFMITINGVTGDIVVNATALVPLVANKNSKAVFHYEREGQDIDVGGLAVGDKIIYTNVSSKKVYGWKIPENARVSITYKTMAVAMGKAVVLLDTNDKVLEFKNTTSPGVGISSQTYTFSTYNAITYLEIPSNLFASAQYTIEP